MRRSRLVLVVLLACASGLGLSACGSLRGEDIVAGEPTGPIVGPTVPGFEPVTQGERLGMPKVVAMGRLGEDENAVYVMRRVGAPPNQPVLIWMHGYGTSHVGSQEPWLTHMTKRATVVFPAYTKPPYPVGPRFGQIAWPLIARSLRPALAKLRYDPRKLVVGGFSLGGALTNDYVVGWKAEGLPKPYGAMAIFPGRAAKNGGERFVPRQSGTVPRDTDLVEMASKNDLLAGTREASFFIAKAKGTARRTLILVHDFAYGDHFAPTRDGLAEQRVFWRPLDRLIDRVNRRADRHARKAGVTPYTPVASRSASS
ncbi:MAG: alpha/beta hydrolase fold domain-containing protein [Solirubrobacteraceae bacterium]|nr:alpha/beta hydrolase fold domain-containing protein [Solirubrobacteraceae bacterium]